MVMFEVCFKTCTVSLSISASTLRFWVLEILVIYICVCHAGTSVDHHSTGKAAFGQVLYHDGELVVAIDLPLTSTTIDLYLLRTQNAAVNCCETACPSAKDQQCWGKETERRYPENSQTANLQQQTWRAIFPGVSFGRYCLKLLEHTQVSTYDPIYTKIFDISSPSIGSPVEEWNVTFFIEQVFLNSERRSVRVAFEVDEEYQEELLDFQLELLCSDCDLTCGDPSSCQVITQEVNLNQKTEHVFTDVTGTYCCAMLDPLTTKRCQDQNHRCWPSRHSHTLLLTGTQDPLPTEVFPPGSPGPLENVIILAPVCIAVVTLLGVFLGVLLSQRQRKPISHRLPFIRIPTSETPCPDDEKMKILLVYNPDNSAFSHLVSAFVQFLTSSGLQVENCCSDEGGKEMTPEELLRILGDSSWSILLVSSMEAKIQQEALLEAQLVENISQSHYMVSNFRYVLWNILDNPVLLKDYTRVSLVRFSEVTADKDRLNFVTPLKEFLVPSHVDDLLQKLQRVTSHGTENEGRHNWSKEMWCHFEALCIQAKAAAAFMQRNKGSETNNMLRIVQNQL